MSNALVSLLARETRAAGKTSTVFDETIEDVFANKASAVNGGGYYRQIEVILETEGVERGTAIVRSLISGVTQ